jgi:glycerol-3-phosphate dehydrogenase (NAD(P)+)
MNAVSVLGLGNWGTALANHLAMKGCQVTGWAIEQEIVDGINERHVNPFYQSDVTLSDNLIATLSLEDALQNDILVLVVPSAALSDVIPKLHIKPDTILVSAIKGIEVSSLSTPLQYCRSVLGKEKGRLAVLSGPSFARDIVRGQPAGVVCASEDASAAKTVAELFQSDVLRVYLSNDPLGVEIGGIAKNVIALAAGVIDGMELGDSARAGLITRGLAEIMRLAVAMGADVQTLSGLSGLGDLVMTATCDTSRNRTVGLRLGKGESLSHIIETLGSVAEAVKSAPLILQLAAKHNVEMPISEAVGRLISESITPEQLVKQLLKRPIKHEFEDLS